MFVKPTPTSSYTPRNITLPYTFSTKIVWCGKSVTDTDEWNSESNTSHRYMHALYTVNMVDTSTIKTGMYGGSIIIFGY